MTDLNDKETSDCFEREANLYAWAHDTIGVNKETFSTRNVPVEKMVRIPIGEEIKTAVLFGARFAVRQFEINRLAACDKQTAEESEREMDFAMNIIEKEHREPTFDDAIKYGMSLQKELMMKDAVNGAWIQRNKYTRENVLYGFDKAGAVIQKFNNGDKVKIIIIKED